MKIYSYLKNSFNDYPGKIACTVFSPMCNFSCWFCHNYDIIKINDEKVSHKEFFSWLKTKKGEVEAVVISGGEPTLQKGLVKFTRQIKKLGFLVKLDTNGTNPKCLEELFKKKLVDFVAMDIKAPLRKYEEVICGGVNRYTILESINLIKKETLKGNIESEFRTTVIPTLSRLDIAEMAMLVGRNFDYALQQYNPQNNSQPKAHTAEFLQNIAEALKKEVKTLKLRI